MKAIVLAYHEVGTACLEEVLKSRIEVVALITHKDDPNEEVWFRTPKAVAVSHGIPVYEPADLKDPQWIDLIKSFGPNYLFSFYYRNMLPKEVLDIPTIAPLNLHGSLLPKYRGRCPVNWVLVKGEEKTGVTLHVMEAKPDAGDIVAQREVPIAFDDTAHSLAIKLTDAARKLMEEALPSLESGSFERRPQAGESSYYGGRRPEDGLIDWNNDAGMIYNLIRAVTHPYPGAFTSLDGRKLLIWKALPKKDQVEGAPGSIVAFNPLLIKTGKGLLNITSLQLEDEDEMNAERFSALHNLDKKVLGGRS